jgi:hypothetical protein
VRAKAISSSTNAVSMSAASTYIARRADTTNWRRPLSAP